MRERETGPERSRCRRPDGYDGGYSHRRRSRCRSRSLSFWSRWPRSRSLAQTAPAARQDTMKPQLVKTIVDKKLGVVLTTAGKQAIYVWNKEPKGKVRCTGACAKAWPPVHREGRRRRADARQGRHGRVRHGPPRRRRAPADVQPPRALHLRAREAQARCCATTSTAGSRSRCTGEAGSAPRDTGRAARLRPPHVSRGDRGRAVVAALGEARVAGRLWSGAAAPERAAVRADPVVGLAHLHGRVDDAAVRPRTTWRLRVDGLVEQPVDADATRSCCALPRAEQVSDFHCVTGWSVKNVHWAGVRFRDLLADRRTAPERERARRSCRRSARMSTRSRSRRPSLPTRCSPTRWTGSRCGASTARRSGVVIPEMYGYKNVKWVERIVVGDRLEPGYWEQRGYDVDAWVGRSNGRVTPSTSSASRARSARCTGSTRAPSSSCWDRARALRAAPERARRAGAR